MTTTRSLTISNIVVFVLLGLALPARGSSFFALADGPDCLDFSFRPLRLVESVVKPLVLTLHRVQPPSRPVCPASALLDFKNNAETHHLDVLNLVRLKPRDLLPRGWVHAPYFWLEAGGGAMGTDIFQAGGVEDHLLLSWFEATLGLHAWGVVEAEAAFRIGQGTLHHVDGQVDTEVRLDRLLAGRFLLRVPFPQIRTPRAWIRFALAGEYLIVQPRQLSITGLDLVGNEKLKGIDWSQAANAEAVVAADGLESPANVNLLLRDFTEARLRLEMRLRLWLPRRQAFDLDFRVGWCRHDINLDTVLSTQITNFVTVLQSGVPPPNLGITKAFNMPEVLVQATYWMHPWLGLRMGGSAMAAGNGGDRVSVMWAGAGAFVVNYDHELKK